MISAVARDAAASLATIGAAMLEEPGVYFDPVETMRIVADEVARYLNIRDVAADNAWNAMQAVTVADPGHNAEVLGAGRELPVVLSAPSGTLILQPTPAVAHNRTAGF